MAVFPMCVDPLEQDTVSTPPRRAAVQKWKEWWLLIEGLFLFICFRQWRDAFKKRTYCVCSVCGPWVHA